MGEHENQPGPRRRRIPGQTLEKRKVSGKPEEWERLEVMADRLGISLSEFLVSTALSPEKESRRAMTAAEAKLLAAELTETRTQLCDLVIAVRNDDTTAGLERFLESAKKTSDRLYDATESLVR